MVRSNRACSLAWASEVETGSTLLGQRRTKPSSSRMKSSNVTRAVTPDDLDVLVTSKNHDVKQAIALDAAAEL